MPIPATQSLREQTIVVTDGKITSVEKGYQPAERYGAEARLVDLKDRFVLPGLIDLHKHISMPLDADRGDGGIRDATGVDDRGDRESDVGCRRHHRA